MRMIRCSTAALKMVWTRFRIVCDSHLQIPLECQLVKTAKNIETIVCYAEENEEKQKALMEAGVQLIKAEKRWTSGLGKADDGIRQYGN